MGRVVLRRMAREADYRLVYRAGSRRSTDVLTIHFRPNDLDSLRLGLAVNRRLGTAVARNRLRRRLREAVRDLCVDVSAGYDLVITPRARAANATYAELRLAVRRAIEAAGIVSRRVQQPQ